ncbi:hypothetical protein HPT25_10935 [Bacillus sp. BRMEA1]|uniref:DUF6609 family protein n=1 Tax=Neobacillus endophyticus TaxID=2738405 RepID=UPI00156554A6|nr:DUF6609 family protein [Neobacillus endophyticus]NRD77897.1 hypothetical protein [Neobacillus endophyticus]
MSNFLTKLGYEKNAKLLFLNKRTCGIWLIWVSLVILLSTIFGGEQKIHQGIFYVGYFAGLFITVGNKALIRKFSYGSPSKFQKKMSIFSIIFMFVLLVLIGGPYFGVHNYRMIWLGAFLAIGLHFFPFAVVHGKSMIALGMLASINALIGILNSSIPFYVIAYIDVILKAIFGFILLFSKNPLQTTSRIQM